MILAGKKVLLHSASFLDFSGEQAKRHLFIDRKCDGLTAGQSEAAAPDYLPHVMTIALSADSGRRVGKQHPS